MPEFSYEAVNEAQERVEDRLTAETVFLAINEIESQGLTITSIQMVSKESPADPQSAEGLPTTAVGENSEQQAIRQQLEKALEDSDTLASALAAFAEELPRGRTRKSLQDLAQRLKSGATAEEILLAKNELTSWLPLLASGIGSNQILSDLFQEASRDHELRTQWFRTLLYPLIVLAVSVGVFVFLCVAVVPTLRQTYEEFGMELPDITVWLIAISSFLEKSPVLIPIAIVGGVVLLALLLRWLSSWGLPGRIWNSLTTGSSNQVLAAGRFTRRLSESLAAGLSVPSALRFAAQATKGRSLRKAAYGLAEDAEHEQDDLKQSVWARRLPATVVSALQAGPDRRPNLRLLDQLADLYTARVRDRCDWSAGFLAQFALVCLGISVGFVVLALFLPLVQLINGLT